jgi:hypothetical protein
MRFSPQRMLSTDLGFSSTYRIVSLNALTIARPMHRQPSLESSNLSAVFNGTYSTEMNPQPWWTVSKDE